MTNNLEKTVLVTYTGMVGMIVGLLIGMDLNQGIHVDRTKVFEREREKPAVMRLYGKGVDSIFVENPKIKGEYTPMSEYLSKITNRADRNIKEAQIKKAVK